VVRIIRVQSYHSVYRLGTRCSQIENPHTRLLQQTSQSHKSHDATRFFGSQVLDRRVFISDCRLWKNKSGYACTKVIRLTLTRHDIYQRRAQKVDSCRQLELFADLNLGASDDEDDAVPASKDRPDGVANLVALLQPQDAENPIMESSLTEQPRKRIKRKGKGKRKWRGNSENNQASKWADKCMYAELLEMKDIDAWSAPMAGENNNGLPEDLEVGWVAVGT
jgi:hypothetical protein